MSTLQGTLFSRSIFNQLDKKLQSTAWNSGVAEAHGVLTGLACRGVKQGHLVKSQYLFQVTSPTDWTIFESLFEMILADLESTTPVFNLLLPEVDNVDYQIAEQIENWCCGFIQGFCYDWQQEPPTLDEEVSELLSDIRLIAAMNAPSIKHAHEQNTRDLVEIEEYLRVGIQLIYEHQRTDHDVSPNADHNANDYTDDDIDESIDPKTH